VQDCAEAFFFQKTFRTIQENVMVSLVFNPETGGGAVVFDQEGHEVMAMLMKRAINTLSNTPQDVVDVSDALSRTLLCQE
jgi:acetylornithine/succinyldiaminopimelate/putrescine aminotransferase